MPGGQGRGWGLLGPGEGLGPKLRKPSPVSGQGGQQSVLQEKETTDPLSPLSPQTQAGKDTDVVSDPGGFLFDCQMWPLHQGEAGDPAHRHPAPEALHRDLGRHQAAKAGSSLSSSVHRSSLRGQLENRARAECRLSSFSHETGPGLGIM